MVAKKTPSGGVTVREVKPRASVQKALIGSDSIDRGASHGEQAPDEKNAVWLSVGVIPPPYDPSTLLMLIENSNSLRQCIDAYVTNIDAFGHRFEPIIDLTAADADDRIRSYLYSKRADAAQDIIDDPYRQLNEPTKDEIEGAKKELAERMRLERMKLEQFFEYASLENSFVTLRRRARQDLEGQGNAYWEVLRDSSRRICGFEYIPGFTVRHLPADRLATDVSYRVKSNEFDYTTTTTKRRFRRYVQQLEFQAFVYFKEFGDPRIVSAHTGHVYASVDAMQEAEPNVAQATEMLHFRIHTSKSSYGIPRWVGNLVSVVGSRQAEEVNLDYFENKSVPPMAILVNGGRLSDDSVKRLQDHMEAKIKGRKNYHRTLIIEAENMGGMDNGRMKVDMKPLTAAQHNDALFQNYDERNIDKVGQAFRLPRMLRGDIRDFNRSTAEAALEFAESQVFRPERDEFDFTINRKILPELGIRFWRFRSVGAASQNPRDLATMITESVDKGILTPAEGRELSQQVFGRELQKIDAPWVRQPIILTQNGITPPKELAAPGMVTPQEAATGTTGAPVVGTPTTAAPGLPGDPGALSSAVDDDAPVALTGTDLATCFTVNEVRGNKKGPLKLPDGTIDPDGFLTVAEFKAKRIAAGTVTGAAEGKDEATDPAATKRSDARDFARELMKIQVELEAQQTEAARKAFDRARQGTAEIEEEDGEPPR